MSKHESARALLKHICDAVNSGDIKELCALYTADCTIIDASSAMRFGGEFVHGREGLRRDMARMWRAFPDCRFHVIDVVAYAETIAAEVQISGTHRGEFMGYAPTERRIEWISHVVYNRDLKSGLLASEAFFYDVDSVLSQLLASDGEDRTA